MFNGWFSKTNTPSKALSYTTKEEENGDWLALDHKLVSPAQIKSTELKKTQEDLRVLELSYQKVCEDYAAEKNHHAKTMELANKLRESNTQLTERVTTLEKNLTESESKSNEHKLIADNALDTLQTKDKVIADLRRRKEGAEQQNEQNFKEIKELQARNQALQTICEKSKSQMVELEKTHKKDVSQIEGLKQSFAEGQRLFKMQKEDSEEWKRKFEQLKLSSQKKSTGGNKQNLYYRYR